MGVWKQWRDRRRRRDETAVLQAIRLLRPEQASAVPISRLAGFGVGRVYPALARMEADGRVMSGWEPPSAFLSEFRPRRRLYRVNGSVTVRVEAGR